MRKMSFFRSDGSSHSGSNFPFIDLLSDLVKLFEILVVLGDPRGGKADIALWLAFKASD